MIITCRDMERRQNQRGKNQIWLTLYPRAHPDPPSEDFGALVAFNELRIPPGGVLALHPVEEVEVVTYVHRGALAQEDSTGYSGVVYAGEFQHMTTGRGIHHKETNASRSHWAHIFRISLHPSEAGLDCAHEQKRFAAALRHNVLCVVASPDGRKGSLLLLRKSFVFSSVLDPGHHLIHEMLPGWSAWLHVIYGKVTLHDIILTEGDGAGVTVEPSVSLTAQENTEILLVDSGPAPGAH